MVHRKKFVIVGGLVFLLVLSFVIFAPSLIFNVDSHDWRSCYRIMCIDKDIPDGNSSEIMKYKSDTRDTLVKMLIEIVGSVTIYFTWRTFQLAAQGRVTDSYNKAIEHLGQKDSPVTRAGGIIGLGRLLRTATPDDDYWHIMDVLTTFVREQAPRNGKVPPRKPGQDVQMALNVLARRRGTGVRLYEREGDAPIDLHDADLYDAWLAGAEFQGAYLVGAHLVDVDASNANLAYADLTGCDLTGADLKHASLHAATLVDAVLLRADFNRETDLREADLTGAHVAQWQIEQATGNGRTKLPSGYSRPAHWQ